MQIPLELTLVTCFKCRSVDIRQDVNKENFLLALDIENHWHETCILTANGQPTTISANGCERIEMSLPRIEVMSPLPNLPKFDHLKLSEREDYDFKDIQSREAFFYKVELLKLITIEWEMAGNKGIYTLHDVELNSNQIRGILKSDMKITMDPIINKVAIGDWQHLNLKVQSLTLVHGLKLEMVLYQDCQNNMLQICDIDQVLVQGKLHRLMHSVDTNWTTILSILVFNPGKYYLKCQVEDVINQKITTTSTFELLCQ